MRRSIAADVEPEGLAIAPTQASDGTRATSPLPSLRCQGRTLTLADSCATRTPRLADKQVHGLGSAGE